MGKAAIFLVTAAMLGFSGNYASQFAIERERDDVQALYQERVLARELAHSAFNVLVAGTAADFENYRPAITDNAYRDGRYTFTAIGDPGAPVSLEATGRVGRAEHSIYATMDRSGVALLDALTIDGPVDEVNASGNSFLIAGLDTNPPGATGSGTGVDTHAIRTLLQTTGDAVETAVDADQMWGVDGNGDLVIGNPALDLDALADSILSHPDRIEYEGKQKFKGNETYGTPLDPVIIVVNGDLVVEGNVEGYGVLYVNGRLKMDGTSRWEGLVYVSSQGGKHEFMGYTNLYGAVIIRTLTSEGEQGGAEDAGLPGGHFDVDVFDESTDSELYHEHQYDDKFDVTYVDLIFSGCDDNGGLCWDEIIEAGGYSDVRAEFFNPNASSGSFVFETTSLHIEGNSTDAFSQRFDPGDLALFRVTFDALCSLRGTKSKNVQNDIANRDGAFSVRVYDVASAGEPLIYELAVYHHIKGQECSGDDGGGSNEFINVDPLEFTINGNAGIYYSSLALSRISELLPTLESEPIELKLTNIREIGSSRVELFQ